MKKEKRDLKFYLNNFETYIAAVLYIFVCALLTTQVISRYLFNHSFTWTEELATLLFVPMIYCGVAAAVTRRQHISIEAVQSNVPFKARKALKIASNALFLFFCFWVQKPFFTVIEHLGDSVYPLLRLQKKYVYYTVPVLLVLTAFRILQDTIRLFKENEETLGQSKPTIDLDACEREYLERKGNA